jgi:hypothetical protein
MKEKIEGKGSKRRRGRRNMDVISWACEHEQGNRTKSFKKYSCHINMIFKKYLSHLRQNIWWRGIIFFHVSLMNDIYRWKMWMKNEKGWTFSWTFATSFVLRKLNKRNKIQEIYVSLLSNQTYWNLWLNTC